MVRSAITLLLLAGTCTTAGVRAKDYTRCLLSSIRQVTFAGRRAGEGYFDKDGRMMVFQSEREPGNPFFQIYLMDMKTGDVKRLSPGVGRTTCAWIHPSGKKVLFSSTHEDRDAKKKQVQELERRKKGQTRRHRWVYDEQFDIYEVDLATGKLTNLTHTFGYDAEGSYSPDGTRILFASNRGGYRGKMNPERQKQFERDPSVAMDLYVMNSDGTGVKQLTSEWGQDGGPFFSADGSKIVWRHFEPNGLHAEIWVMNADGTGKKQITHLGAMSWAPFFHPSGKYVIFTTNRHGFDNFELYIVDSEGRHEPVRVTNLPGFDGLPVFTPDGLHLAWTSNRTPNRQGQIFMADWNHDLALYLLGLSSVRPPSCGPNKMLGYRDPAQKTVPEIRAADLSKHVHFLASKRLRGRLAGTAGEREATAYVARIFKRLGLKPAGDKGYYQPFEFTRAIRLEGKNELSVRGKNFKVNKDWLPLPYSENGSIAGNAVVFAGYGIVAELDGKKLDAYAGLDAKGKWVMVLRDLPGGLDQRQRLQLAPWADERRKVAEAKARGAAGVIVVTPAGAGFKKELIPLNIQGTAQRAGVLGVSVTRRLADRILRPAGKTVGQLTKVCNEIEKSCSLEIGDVSLSVTVTLKEVKGTARNALGRLASAHPVRRPLLIGAHADHIGNGIGMGSLARPEERGKVHPGADDNASGVAAMLEMAEWFSNEVRAGRIKLERDIIFAAWSGEEEGLLGSGHYVKATPKEKLPAAAINMDMIGRLRDKLILYGLETSPVWARLIEKNNVALGLPIVVQNQSMLPTDATSFVLAGVAVLSAFTGLHDEYNTPRDTPRTIDYFGQEKVTRLVALIARDIATNAVQPVFTKPAARPPSAGGRHGMRASLGTVPDFSAVDVKGVRLSGVRPGSPAERAGLKAGDVVVELAGQKIENLYDYARAIGALKIGEPAELVVERAGKKITLKVTPESRK